MRAAPLTLVLFAACVAPGPGADSPDADLADPGGPDAGVLPPLGEGLVTLAGSSQPGYVDGDRAVARFANPVNVVALADGAVLVCDFDNGRLRRVDGDGQTSTLVETPAGFARPFGAVRDRDVVWIQTDRNAAGEPGGALWKLELDGPTLHLIRDDAGRYRGLAVRADGKLVLADQQRHVIDVLDPDDGAITRLAGMPQATGQVDDAGTAARFDTPLDVIALPDNDVLVADHGNGAIRRVTAAGVVSTFTTGLASPAGLARGADGTIYVSDPEAGVVRRLDAAGTTMTTFAGSGEAGHGDDADPRAGQLHGLEGIDVSVDGAYLFVADGSRGEDLPYHFVRRISID